MVTGYGWRHCSPAIGAFTLASYLFLYTPLKQRTWWSTTWARFWRHAAMIGFAAPPAPLRRSVGAGAILFVWQFRTSIHRLMYKETTPRRHPYAAGGRARLRSTARQIVIYGNRADSRELIPSLLGCRGASRGRRAAADCGSCTRRTGALERTLSRARGVLLTSVLYCR